MLLNILKYCPSGGFVNIGEEGEKGEWLLPRHLIPPASVTIFGRRSVTAVIKGQLKQCGTKQSGIIVIKIKDVENVLKWILQCVWSSQSAGGRL